MLIAPEKICFGRWQLDAQRRTLLADGTPVALNGRAFDLLELLVARRGQAVTRDELIAHVWQDVTVGENNLTVQMSYLRKVLSDGRGDGAGLILTVPRGYKFAGEVEELPVPARPTNKSESTLVSSASSMPVPYGTPAPRFAGGGLRVATSAAVLLLLVCGAALVWQQAPKAPRLSIAVLPFRNLSADHAQGYLADALTDDLTTDLAHIPGSTVIARESADVWRGKAATVQQIGRALMVRYLLEGSLRAEDGRYHVNAQLIDTTSGAHLWAERFDFPDGKISEVRNAIVGRLAAALDFRLAQVESSRSVHDRPNNPDALDLFFQARAILDSDNSLLELTHAQRLLEQALLQEPDFSDAAAELGTLLMMKVEDTDDPQEVADIGEAHREITKALALSPRNALALTARAREFANRGAWVEASFSATAALAIDPSNVAAHTELARSARAEGKLDEAALEIEKILRLSPNTISDKRRYLTLGFIRLLQFRVDDSVNNLQLAIAGDAEGGTSDAMGRVEVSRLLLIATTVLRGHVEEAHASYLEHQKIWPNRTLWRFAAYFKKSEASLPAFGAVMNALEQAGMRRFAGERDPTPAIASRCKGGDFDITPQLPARSHIWFTTDIVLHLKSFSDTFIIDVGHGAAVPLGATWRGWGAGPESKSDFAIKTVFEHNRVRPNDLILIMGDGPFGCGSYEAAEAVAERFPRIRVAWYRGGEEAWIASKLPAEDRRP